MPRQTFRTIRMEVHPQKRILTKDKEIRIEINRCILKKTHLPKKGGNRSANQNTGFFGKRGPASGGQCGCWLGQLGLRTCLSRTTEHSLASRDRGGDADTLPAKEGILGLKMRKATLEDGGGEWLSPEGWWRKHTMCTPTFGCALDLGKI